MRLLKFARVLNGLLLVELSLLPLHAQQAPSAPVSDPVADTTVHAHEELAGTWEYNAPDSINILTGRSEQAPRSATQRGRGARGAPPPVDSGTAIARDRGDRQAAAGVGPTPEMVRENQETARDLLEVPETLKIRVTPDAVTITDDLDRERRYPTDGRRQKYRLAAAQYEALVQWQGSQLKMDIEGGFGFKLTQTFFLSADARRLFVIVRVGQPRKDQPQAGFNRVYDRVEG
ncbi:MAG: hypothetical protein ABI051_09075 [Vicinamibacterales bacterium]